MSSHPANNANPDRPSDPPENPSNPSKGGSRFSDLNKVLPVAIGITTAGVAVAAVPIVVAAVGFGAGGISAGSLAASMMSTAATSGIGMGAVATLQSVGAAGLAASTQILIGTAAGIGGAAVAAAQTKEAPPGKGSNVNNPLTKPDTPHWVDGFGWRSATGIGMGAVATLQSVGAAGLAASKQILIDTAAGIGGATVAAAQTKEAPPGKDSKGNNPLTKTDIPHWADGFRWRSATGIGMGAVAALQSAGAAGLAASTQILSGTAAGISRAAVAVAQTKETPPGKDSKGNNPTEKGPGRDGSRGSGSEGTGPGGDGTKEPFGRERAWWRW